jgi:transcriptional regulator with XRE-family HTH domain
VVGDDGDNAATPHRMRNKTQDEISRAAGMDQSEISRVEQRDDLRLSTLRRYANASMQRSRSFLSTGHRIKLDLTQQTTLRSCRAVSVGAAPCRARG